jgi:hypothetical protein
MSGTSVDAHGLDDPALIEFAAGARMVPLPARGDVIARFSDMEIVDSVAHRDGEFVLESSERGGQARRDVASESIIPVRRALVRRFGSALRFRQGLSRFVLPNRVEDLPAGFRLVEEPGSTVLSWEDAGQPLSARFFGALGTSEAVQFAHIARVDEHELIVALTEPDGQALLSI